MLLFIMFSEKCYEYFKIYVIESESIKQAWTSDDSFHLEVQLCSDFLISHSMKE